MIIKCGLKTEAAFMHYRRREISSVSGFVFSVNLPFFILNLKSKIISNYYCPDMLHISKAIL